MTLDPSANDPPDWASTGPPDSPEHTRGPREHEPPGSGEPPASPELPDVPPACDPPRSRLRWSVARKLRWGLGVCLAFFLVAEVGCRIAYHGRWPYHLVFDEELIWAHRPNWKGQTRAGSWSRFNALGLREDREFSPTKERPRVLVVGDSIAFGYGLQQDETISHQLEGDLRARGYELDVINAGVSGYGPEQETVWLERIGPSLVPDLVLLFFCMSNDVSVEPVASHLERQTAFGPGRKSLAVRSETLRAAFDHSALAFAIGRRVNRARVKRERAEVAANAQQGLRFSNLADFSALPESARAVELEVLRQRLDAFARAARALGARVAVVVFPAERLLAPGAEGPVDEVCAVAKGLGLEVLDLLPGYRSYPAARPPLLRAKDGIHPSAAGAEWVAERLATWLEGKGLVPTAVSPAPR